MRQPIDSLRGKKMTENQAMFSIVAFNFGSSLIMGISTGVNQDAWISILAATVMAIPILFLYARIIRLFPGKNIFSIAETLFGKIGGKIFTLFFIWYAIHLAALVLRNFSEFTQISAMPETPQLLIMILMILTTIYLARSGMRAVGKWAIVASVVVLFVVAFTFLASIHRVRISNLLPVMSHPVGDVMQTAFQIFSFPYAEIVLFLCLCDFLEEDAQPYRMFRRALLWLLFIFLLVFVRNLTLLGRSVMSETVFPSYVAARIIEVGNFLARIEGSTSSNFVMAGIVKISISLLAAARGIASLFSFKNHHPLIVPTGMLVLALGAIVFRNSMEMMNFSNYYPYYAFPFQVVLPLIIWIAGEIHIRKQKQASSA